MQIFKTIFQKINFWLENILPRPVYFLTSHRISSRLMEQNRCHNHTLPVCSQPITNQYAHPVRDFHIGKYTACYNGCASIALFNALLCKNCPLPFPQIISRVEQEGCLSFQGKFGTSPYKLERILRSFPVSCSRHKKLSDLEQALEIHDAAILFVWNDCHNLAKGAHFFTVRKTSAGYEVYNRLAPMSDTDSLSSIVGNSCFITGYRIF